MKKILLILAALISTPAFAGEIVVSNKARSLTYIDDLGLGHTFPVAIGKRGVQFHGSYYIDRKAEWPTWTPTPNMCAHKGICKPMKGGGKNPLGARAMYLAGTLFRIHGTIHPESIGKAASAGCIRMRNPDVITLYSMVPVGTHVTVR